MNEWKKSERVGMKKRDLNNGSVQTPPPLMPIYIFCMRECATKDNDFKHWRV